MADDASTADVDMRKMWWVLAAKMAVRPGWLASCDAGHNLPPSLVTPATTRRP